MHSRRLLSWAFAAAFAAAMGTANLAAQGFGSYLTDKPFLAAPAAGAVSLFDPSTLGEMIAAFDTLRTSTIYPTNNAALADGVEIYKWADHGGPGHHMTNSGGTITTRTATYYATGGPNNGPRILVHDYPNNNAYFGPATNYPAPTPATILAVIKPNVSAKDSCVLGFGNGLGPVIEINSTYKWRIGSRMSLIDNAGGPITNNWLYLVATFGNGSSSVFRTNGAACTTGNTGDGFDTKFSPNHRTGPYYFSGSFARLWVWKKTLNSNEIWQAEQSVKTEFGL